MFGIQFIWLHANNAAIYRLWLLNTQVDLSRAKFHLSTSTRLAIRLLPACAERHLNLHVVHFLCKAYDPNLLHHSDREHQR